MSQTVQKPLGDDLWSQAEKASRTINQSELIDVAAAPQAARRPIRGIHQLRVSGRGRIQPCADL